MDAGPQVRAKPIRQELEAYCLPSVRIENSTIIADKRVHQMYLFHFSGQPARQLVQSTDYIDLDIISYPKTSKSNSPNKNTKTLNFKKISNSPYHVPTLKVQKVKK